MSALSRPEFHSEEAAFAHLEKVIWGGEPTCPHCGGVDRITKVKANPDKRIRMGLWRCGDCKKQFTVKVGTVFEHMRLPLNKALQAVYLMTSSKKGISAHQIHRILEITYKSAWFLCHRIREAMTSEGGLLGGAGGMVEVDETLYCRKPGVKVQRGTAHLNRIMALIDRESGESRAMVVDFSGTKKIGELLQKHVSTNAHFMTDEWGTYKALGWNFAQHSTVNHKRDEYVNRDNPTIHTNTVEGYFSIFKRGMRGVYQHCGEQHLGRYVTEFNFRYANRAKLGINDAARAERAIKGIVGKRLTYKGPNVYA